MRSNVGIVRAISVHDERGAGFRAVGYARQNGRPAAVVTSSGTAVANLYPSIVEASSDGVPLILITADRPYENRENGSNQSIDQVKIFSSSYVRWFRDILPPSDDVPVSVALSDANHAVAITRQLMGPVHLNVQFRENLAPEDGPIRNDNRIGSMTKFNNKRFTDVPGFSRWSSSGNRWQKTFYPNINAGQSIMEVVELIIKSRRGIIVTGNLRGSDSDGADFLTTTISHFAKVIGFPIFASVQSGGLRREHPVVPYAEHLLKNPLVSNGMRPDLVLQLGSPLISTEITQVIRSNPSVKHVLIQRMYQHERADPEQTVTHRVSSDIGTFLNSLIWCLGAEGYFGNKNFGSELSPLLYLGRKLGAEMQSTILETTSSSTINGDVCSDDCVSLTEPQVMMAIAEILSESISELSSMSLFLSNSMPVRDGESFFYPSNRNKKVFPLNVSVNRGASGIDGIISTATGCGDNAKPTTLVCGDVTTLHDLNAFYGLTQDDASSSDDQPASAANCIPLTTVVVNNGGGAIFSFLPISKFGEDVGFEEFWGTPTDNFSFRKGVAAFGLPYKVAYSFESFKDAYRTSIRSSGPTVIEARVVKRAANVAVHQKITCDVRSIVDEILGPPPTRDRVLPVKEYCTSPTKKVKTMLLLHGWMGDKSEWDLIGDALRIGLPEEWRIISIDLPGHGDSSIVLSSHQQIAHSSLGLDAMRPFGPPESSPFSLDMMARAVCHSLIHDHGVEQLDAIVGYSLGGRIALAMKRLYSMSLSSLNRDIEDRPHSIFLTDETKLILLSSSPGNLPHNTNHGSTDDLQRLSKDFSIAESLFSSAYRSYATSDVQDMECLTRFLTNWYTQSLWGDLRMRHPMKHQAMMTTRLKSLVRRRLDIASVLYGCSPPLSSQEDWKAVVPSKTLFVAGELDKKYSSIGRAWDEIGGISRYIELENAGHALVLEEPEKVSLIISDFVKGVTDDRNLKNMGKNEVYNPITSEYSMPVEEEDVITPSPLHQVGIMEYEAFRITVGSGGSGLLGIGWGESARAASELKRREGFIISIASRDGMAVGVGEVSPLMGLHMESLEQSENQLKLIQKFLSSDATEWPELDAKRVLSLGGSLTKCVNDIFNLAGIHALYAAQSVRSGLEMAILSLCSQLSGTLLPQALAVNQQERPRLIPQLFGQLPINGLITKGETLKTRETDERRRGKNISFKSVKIKVGHGDPSEDVLDMIRLKAQSNERNLKIRADANRAWDFPTAQLFIDELKRAARAGSFVLSEIEFLEEPLEVQTNDGKWTFRSQIAALERLADGESLNYALDETIADLAVILGYDFDRIACEMRTVFGGEKVGRNGCAAFVLKPALLGLELSMQLARLAQKEFQISPVFSSSFDSGIGLAYTAILAAVSDNSPHSLGLPKFPHGLGTFDKLDGDTMSPPFESYVNKKGVLNVPSLSRALYGLSLDEMSDRVPTFDNEARTAETAVASSYLATTFTSGRDITVSVSLPLPFSDRIASSRFTDLPQMSRWSPWLNSVTYLDESPGLTEWNLSIRGVKFSWKAKSEIIANPKGIQWDSISGLKNRGVVEFEPTSEDSCVMRLRMSIIMPYILVALFQGMPSVVQEFLQNKLLKWSLEMFRDVVKADLALERGDQELGDALFGAVEGRANALEEALK
jgi:2-succinyl-5-enolpyruvyl-6-hydroxy-3-cyclohexene-1-carboxylate synthase